MHRTAVALLIVSAVTGCAFAGGDTLSRDELHALKQFRAFAKDLLKSQYERSDNYLIHWLRAQNLDVQAATNMLAKNKAWRKEQHVDKILDNKEVIDMMQLYPAEYGVAKDKDGKPAIVFSGGKWNFLKGTFKGHDLPKVATYQLERMFNILVATNQSQFLYVNDLNQFNLRQHACLACTIFYTTLITQYELYYPNCIKSIFLFNAPSVYEPILKLVRSLMSPISRKSLQVFGHDKAEWQPEILKHFDASQLTKAFGGTKQSNE